MSVGSILDYCRYLKGKLLGLCGSKRIFTVGDIVELTGEAGIPHLGTGDDLVDRVVE